jgi:hypothetical protein
MGLGVGGREREFGRRDDVAERLGLVLHLVSAYQGSTLSEYKSRWRADAESPTYQHEQETC